MKITVTVPADQIGEDYEKYAADLRKSLLMVFRNAEVGITSGAQGRIHVIGQSQREEDEAIEGVRYIIEACWQTLVIEREKNS